MQTMTEPGFHRITTLRLDRFLDLDFNDSHEEPSVQSGADEIIPLLIFCPTLIRH